MRQLWIELFYSSIGIVLNYRYKCSFTITEYIYLYSYLSNVCPLVNLIAKNAFYNPFDFINLYENPVLNVFKKVELKS